jgi:molecular chaperone GrpE
VSESSGRQAVEEAGAGEQPQPDEPDEATEPQGPARDLDAELTQIEDRYKRALADLDNYRKRSASEIERRVSERTDQITRDWLETMDSVERALRMSEPTNPMAAGLRAVLEQMEAILDRQGVTRMGAVGEPFDPGVHEAVGVRETDDVPAGTIVDVARSGFNRGDRVLRPAQVVVSRRGGGGEG